MPGVQPESTPASPVWCVEWTRDGSPTLRHSALGEACHSREGAWQEARERYAAATRLRERALAGDLSVARLLDVGTGLGWNLAAALEALDGTGVSLRAVSLELDPTVLQATLAVEEARAAPAPPEQERWHAPVRRAFASLLSRPPGEPTPFEGSAGSLRVLFGDGRETLPRLPSSERFDAVFLDPFSPRVDPTLWEQGFLSEVAHRMAPGSWLSTYTASLTVRARLVASGLAVGPGARVGTKREGTLASPDRDPGAWPARMAGKLARRARRLWPGASS